jgi:hypothetical protein
MIIDLLNYEESKVIFGIFMPVGEDFHHFPALLFGFAVVRK